MYTCVVRVTGSASPSSGSIKHLQRLFILLHSLSLFLYESLLPPWAPSRCLSLPPSLLLFTGLSKSTYSHKKQVSDLSRKLNLLIPLWICVCVCVCDGGWVYNSSISDRLARYKKRVRVEVWRRGWREEKRREEMNELKRLFSFLFPVFSLQSSGQQINESSTDWMWCFQMVNHWLGRETSVNHLQEPRLWPLLSTPLTHIQYGQLSFQHQGASFLNASGFKCMQLQVFTSRSSSCRQSFNFLEQHAVQKKKKEEEEEEEEENIGYFFLVHDEISQTPWEKCRILWVGASEETYKFSESLSTKYLQLFGSSCKFGKRYTCPFVPMMNVLSICI